MKPLEIAPAARDDLIAIGSYIAEDNLERALSFIAELEAKAMQAAERPRTFPARDDISEGLRGAVHGAYLLLFRDLPDCVRIVRVLHSARNHNRLF